MSTARFLLALACTCTSATFGAAGESLSELELQLARKPSLYVRLDVRSGLLQVMVRGFELDRMQTASVRLVARRAAGQVPSITVPELPVVWRVASPPAVTWRKVVAPSTLVPYQDGSPPPSPLPTSTPPPDLPGQYQVEFDSGWTLHLGDKPPDRWPRRVASRIGSGWRRLTGRAVAPAPPARVVVTQPEDSRRLLHLLVKGTPLLLFCGDVDQSTQGDTGGSASGASATAVGTPS
jgi:hypothetical protein